MDEFRHRIAIIKADDLGRFRTYEAWWRLLDAADRRGVPISAGAVGSNIAESPSAEIDRLAAHFRHEGHEVWNHSHAHMRMTELSPEEQMRDLQTAQVVLNAAFGARPTVFGAPFNLVDRTLVESVEALPDLKGIFQARVPTELGDIPAEATMTPEVVDHFGRQPEFDGFRRRFNRFARKHLLVIQCHPPGWTAHGVHEFEQIIDFLLDRNWQFATAAEYLDYRRWRDGYDRWPTSARARLFAVDEEATDHFSLVSARPDAPKKERASFYFNRYRRGSAPLANLFFRAGWRNPGAGTGDRVRGLDIGTGAGNWAFAYASLSDRHEAYGLDTDRYLMGHLNEIAGKTGFADRATFVEGSAIELPFPESEFDHVCCYNALNYFDPEVALREIRRVLKPRGSLYLGLQNETFYLKGFYDNLVAGETAAGLRRIDQLAYKAGARRGLVGGPAYARMWRDPEIVSLANALGLGPKGVDTPLKERTQHFLGKPLFTTYTFSPRDLPLSPAGAVPDGADAKSATRRLREIFDAGGYRLFLEATATLSDEVAAAPAMARSLAAASALRGELVELPDFIGAAVARQDVFAEAVRLYLGERYDEAAQSLTALAEVDDDPDLDIVASVALYAAGQVDAAIEFAARRFSRVAWDEDHWHVWLTLVTAAKENDEAVRAFRDYLAWRYETTFGTSLDPALVLDGLEDIPHQHRSAQEAERVSIARTHRELSERRQAGQPPGPAVAAGVHSG